MAVIKLTGATKDYIWGGRRLIEEYGKKTKDAVMAESWELSCHPDGESIVVDEGITLSSWLKEQPGEPLGTNCRRFGGQLPILIKLIDAAAALSVQVHPSDEYAHEHEGQNGKTEVWYIVDCGPEAFLYYGVAAPLTREQFSDAVFGGDVTQLLRKVRVKPGEVYFIPAGTIHAIGADIIIAEIQQNSNVTYRVYDYDRRDAQGNPRQMHREQAIAVSTLAPNPDSWDFGGHLALCEYFCVDKLSIHGGAADSVGSDSFVSLLTVSGSVSVTCGGKTVTCGKGESLLLTAGSGAYSIDGDGVVLKTTVPAV